MSTNPHATVTKQSFPLCGAVTSAHTNHTFTCPKGQCATLSTIPGTAHRAGLAARHFRTNRPSWQRIPTATKPSSSNPQ